MAEAYETFTWCGQTRYRCRLTQSDGSPCPYDTYSLEYMVQHEHKNHAPQIPNAIETAPMLFDSRGDRIQSERGIPPEFQQYRFKK